MLADDEWRTWSNEEIARRVHVSPHTVADMKSALTLQIQSEEQPSRKFTNKHGQTATMNTENIGKRMR